MNQNDIILFQGDSITDAGRYRENQTSLGEGYPLLLAARLLFERPDKNLTVLNRGISGNKISDLYARWKTDALLLKPTVLSVLIGINDIWHEYSVGAGVDAKPFERLYDMLLSETEVRLPNVQLILCEPFCLCGTATEARWQDWSAEVPVRRKIVKGLAEKHGCVFVPLQAAFDEAAKTAPASYWLSDGVHPTPAGHKLIARQWLKNVLEIKD